MDWKTIIVVVVVFVAFFIWKRSSLVSPETARQYLTQGALVIDVRSRGEFQGGHVQGAINIPLDELEQGVSARVKDKQQVLLLHCLSGTRSGIALRQLKAMGYANVFNLGSLARARGICGKPAEH